MKVTIMDYGVGNLHSIAKGLERAGADVFVVTDPRKLKSADSVVFPGVGAFGAAAEVLRPAKDALRTGMLGGLPTLGVCLGMQLLFERSEESSGEGLSVIRGEVRKLKAQRVPHMGWNMVDFGADPLFEGVSKDSRFYFANSYVCWPSESVTIATTDYGERFPSAVRRGNLCGVQFHPEKSGSEGLKVLENFIRMAEGGR